MVEGRRVVEDGEGRITHQQANTTEAPSSNDNERKQREVSPLDVRTLRVYRHPPFKGSREQAARGCHRRVRRVAGTPFVFPPRFEASMTALQCEGDIAKTETEMRK